MDRRVQFARFRLSLRHIITEELTGQAPALSPIDGTNKACTGSEHGCSKDSLGSCVHHRSFSL